ncbi:hypothetical protein F5X98DRAFT_85901 [Xylaria grammica]|nr:hypothetical protein F5X98DRAFT_85901 [Xylaria grammica]
MAWELTRRRIVRAINSKFIFDRIVCRSPINALSHPCTISLSYIRRPRALLQGDRAITQLSLPTYPLAILWRPCFYSFLVPSFYACTADQPSS